MRIYKDWMKAKKGMAGNGLSKDPRMTSGQLRGNSAGNSQMSNGNTKDGSISVIREREIPSQREIKNGEAPLTPRESLVVRDCPGET